MEEFDMYTGFAYVYDEFMDNIPYDEWHEYLHDILKSNGVTEGLVAELACGTGIMTEKLAKDGYDMIGIDLSYDMLEVARERCPENVLLLEQDMREVDLYGSVAAFVCVCDGMNYLIEDGDLYQTFKKVKTFLDYGGVFIFDMKTEYFYQNVLGDRTIVDNREDTSFIWENQYDKDTCINEYLLTIYALADDENDMFERCDELHRQRAYKKEFVKQELERAGLELLNIYEAFTKNEPSECSERLYFVARRNFD